MSGKAQGLLAAVLAPPDGDPYAAYAQLREQAPALVTTNGTLILSRFADVRDAMRNPAVGKPSQGYAVQGRGADEHSRAAMERWQHTILFANPPEHTRLRHLISSQFTPRHVERLRDQVAAAANRFLDGLDQPGGADFIAAVAQPLPAQVVANLLGIPGDDWPGLAAAVRDVVNLFEPSAPPDAAVRSIAAQDQLGDFFAPILASKREHPGDDLLSRLAAAHDADALDDTEMIATAILLFAAGFETTVNLLGNGLHALLTHPDQLRLLRERPELVPGAVEEFLRYDSPVQFTSRAVLAPCQIGDVQLSPGRDILLFIGAANRDPAHFTSPDQFDVTRSEGTALSFATGSHFCLGAHLARLEAVEVFTCLLARYGHLELAAAPRRRPGTSLRGFAELEVTARR